MATAPAKKAGIDWGKALRWIARLIWATTVLLLKVFLIVFTAIVVFIVGRRNHDIDDENKDHDEHRASDQAFDRDSPINKHLPYE